MWWHTHARRGNRIGESVRPLGATPAQKVAASNELKCLPLISVVGEYGFIRSAHTRKLSSAHEPILDLYLFSRPYSNFSWNTNCLKFLSWFYIVSKEIPGWYNQPSTKQRPSVSKSLSSHHSWLFYPLVRRSVTSGVGETFGNLRITIWIRITIWLWINKQTIITNLWRMSVLINMSHKGSEITYA
jgi:hypothetical protein